MVVSDASPLDVPSNEQVVDVGWPYPKDLFIGMTLLVEIRRDDDDERVHRRQINAIDEDLRPGSRAGADTPRTPS